MWQNKTESELKERILKISINDSGLRLRFSDVLTLLCDSADFRRYLTDQLSSVPFNAFRWETPPVTTTSINRYFECVILDSPELSRMPDVKAFGNYFKFHDLDNVVPNLGNDAMMVVPCPIGPNSAYGRIADFLRNAPEPQIHSLWKSVGQAMLNRISSEPVWLNTAGASVPWLHVRLDSRPKYYRYLPYKAIA